MIEHSIEINRWPEDVFAYLDQLERHVEWQSEVVSAEIVTSGTVGVGTRVREVRRFAGREMDASYEITEHDPPRPTAFRGLEGPARPGGTVTAEPLGDGTRSRVSIDFDPRRPRHRQADRAVGPDRRGLVAQLQRCG